jgi:hypothetical protein
VKVLICACGSEGFKCARNPAAGRFQPMPPASPFDIRVALNAIFVTVEI